MGMGGSRLFRHRVLGAVAGGVLGVLAAACGESAVQTAPFGVGDGPGPLSTATTSRTSPPDTNQSSAAETTSATPVLSAPDPADGEAFDEYIAGRVQAFYEVRDRAFAEPSATPEIDYPELAELAVEPQLSAMYDAIRQLHDAGRAHRDFDEAQIGTTTDDEHRTSGVQSVDGAEVTVFNCEANDDDVVDVSTGEVVIAGTLTILEVVTLRQVEEDWRVVSATVTRKVEGVAGCYLAREDEFPY